MYQSLQHKILFCFHLPQTLVMNLFPTMNWKTCFQWDMQASKYCGSLMKKKKRKNLWKLFQRTNFIMAVLATIYAKFKSMSWTKWKCQHLCTVSPPVSNLAFVTKIPLKKQNKINKVIKGSHPSTLGAAIRLFCILRYREFHSPQTSFVLSIFHLQETEFM